MEYKKHPIRYRVEPILEFNDFFPDEELNIRETLIHYSREMLLKFVGVLENRYINVRLVDEKITFFSENSKSHMSELNARLTVFKQNNNDANPMFCTRRTNLEILRIIFSIPIEQYKNDFGQLDLEYNFFKIILKVNQNLMNFNKSNDNETSIFFLLNYVQNDIVNAEFINSMCNQSFYFSQLVAYLNRPISDSLRQSLLTTLGVESLTEYYKTILSIYKFCEPQLTGSERQSYIRFPVDCIEQNKQFISQKVIDYLSIDWNTLIKYDIDDNQKDNNTDYRYFRSHPLIRLSDGTYMVYSFILLTERLFNSLYFDLKNESNSLPKDKKLDFTNWFNKEFIEHYVFQRTMLNTLGRRTSYYYPPKDIILSDESRKEKKSEPDFYIREENAVVLFECKSIKLNGSIKDKADADRLLHDIKLKLFSSDENIDNTRTEKKKKESVGVTQLVNHLLSIEDDDYPWDKGLKDPYIFYPILIVDDWKLSQVGMSCMLNDWYFELLKEYDLIDEFIKPIVIIPIEVLYFYSDTFRSYGFAKILEEYLNEYEMKFDIGNYKWTHSHLADFNLWIKRYRRNPNANKQLNNWCFSYIKG
jgi:hypothetical protein